MGEVWRAHDRALRREVALKILSPEHGRNPSAIARFEREIHATSEVAHANVVRIHDWGITDDGVWYYAMDLVLDGLDLSTLVRRSGPMPAALVVQLGRGAASGLAESAPARNHPPRRQAGQPVRDRGRRRAAPHRAARLRHRARRRRPRAHPGRAPCWARRRSWRRRRLAGAGGATAADVYGFAASLYFALTGRSPRDAGGVAPSALVDAVPAALDDVIVRSLDAEPSRRPTAAEVERALELLAVDWRGSWRVSKVVTVPPPISDPTTDDDAPRTVVEPIRSRSPG